MDKKKRKIKEISDDNRAKFSCENMNLVSRFCNLGMELGPFVRGRRDFVLDCGELVGVREA